MSQEARLTDSRRRRIADQLAAMRSKVTGPAATGSLVARAAGSAGALGADVVGAATAEAGATAAGAGAGAAAGAASAV
jgi:hypothetical protein